MPGLAIVEAGSTFTKAYVARNDGAVTQVGMRNINFKSNYAKVGQISEADLEELRSLIRELQEHADEIHVYGTSIFRSLPVDSVSLLRRSLVIDGAKDFTVVTAKEESEYTSFGAIRGLSYPGHVAVMVGGGGSTEVSIYERSALVDESLSPIGVLDVNRAFPDLQNDLATSSPAEVSEWIAARLQPIDSRADLLVLAGGNFPLLYQNAGYALISDPYSSDPEKSQILSTEQKRKHDTEYFHRMPLSKFRGLTPDTPSWWDGTRAMCCFVDAVARQVGASELVPTRISMVFGIAARLLDR